MLRRVLRLHLVSPVGVVVVIRVVRPVHARYESLDIGIVRRRTGFDCVVEIVIVVVYRDVVIADIVDVAVELDPLVEIEHAFLALLVDENLSVIVEDPKEVAWDVFDIVAALDTVHRGLEQPYREADSLSMPHGRDLVVRLECSYGERVLCHVS